MNFYGSKHIHAANTRKHVKNTALKGKFRLFFCSPTACSPNHAGPIRPRLAGRDANDIKQILSTFNHVMEDPCRTRRTLSLATQLNYAAWPGNAACSELRGRRRRQPVKVRSGKLWEIRTTLELETRPAACVCTSLVTQLRQSPAAGPTWRVWAEKSRFCWSDGESATGRKIALVGGKVGGTQFLMIW